MDGLIHTLIFPAWINTDNNDIKKNSLEKENKQTVASGGIIFKPLCIAHRPICSVDTQHLSRFTHLLYLLSRHYFAKTIFPLLIQVKNISEAIFPCETFADFTSDAVDHWEVLTKATLSETSTMDRTS
jgi:hypothetical protein